VDKQKELCYAKALQKGDVRPSTLFRLISWPSFPIYLPRLLFYELLSMREALGEALTNSEIFLTQILPMPEEEDDEHCHQASRQFLMYNILSRGYANQREI